MKHILPILTITTLAAAASAQTAAAAPAGLSYNQIGLSYSNSTKAYSLDASAVIAGTNLFVTAETDIGGKNAATAKNGHDSVGLGYLFRNLALGTDLTLAIGSNETYALGLRRALGAGFEGKVSYERASGANVYGAEVAYNINAHYALSVGYAKTAGVSGATTFGARYNF